MKNKLYQRLNYAKLNWRLLAILFLAVLSTHPATAKDVQLRTGAHADYARLVFDWPDKTQYTVSRAQKDTLTIKFKQGATPILSSENSAAIANISKLNILKTDPLEVAITIPADTRTRDMQVGNKVIIDVFNPENGATPKTKLNINAPKPKAAPPPKPSPKSAPESPPEPETKPAIEPETKTQKPEKLTEADKNIQLPATEPIKPKPETESQPESQPEPEKVLATNPKLTSEQTPETISEPIPAANSQPPTLPLQQPPKLQMHDQPTMVTISSTKNFGMAAFMLDEQLWLVNDKSNVLINPQINGPLAKSMQPVIEIESNKGKAYSLALPREKKQVKGLGGGILWRVMLGDALGAKPTPVQPIRDNVERDEPRSGKLLWPLKNAQAVLDFENPLNGRPIKVITVQDAEQFTGTARSFIDFDVLESVIGMAIIPKVSDLDVKITNAGVEISREGGLSLVNETLLESMVRPKMQTISNPNNTTDENTSQSPPPETELRNSQRLFDFKSWQLGGIKTINENKRTILEGLKTLSDTAKSENLLTLAKMYIANAMGPESLGVLGFAARERPDLWDSPEFTALYGVASTLTYHNEDGFAALSIDELKSFEEVNYWRAMILADEGDWQQAAKTLPQDLFPLYDFPVQLQNRIVPQLAEITLRAGDIERSDMLLKMSTDSEKQMTPAQRAELQYLRGEAARQKGDIDLTKKLWLPLTTGDDDLYRAKAGLALTRLLIERNEIDIETAIDRLEKLRYAWRGDELEVQINYWLGKTYFENGDFLRGLILMRDAVSFDEGTPLGRRIAAEMGTLFTQAFTTENLEKTSPLNAVALYDEFKELVPLDERGSRIIERLAERLAAVDLLGRAGDLLKYQVDHRLEGSEAFRVGVRLAAIRLLDSQYDQAIQALDTAATQLETLPEEFKTAKAYREMALLHARAISRKGRPDQALELIRNLDQTPETNRMKADIAWLAGYWDDAAQAMEDVIMDEDIDLEKPLNTEHTALILQRAVALNLSNDRIALANLRQKYTPVMSKTDKAKTFDIITRPRKTGALADRDTLLSVVSEVDLFKEFLNTYKDSTEPVN